MASKDRQPMEIVERGDISARTQNDQIAPSDRTALQWRMGLSHTAPPLALAADLKRGPGQGRATARQRRLSRQSRKRLAT
jgi:hypothetical protein